MAINSIPGGQGKPRRTPPKASQNDAAKQYYLSQRGGWLHKAIGVDFRSLISPLEWILNNMPGRERQPLDVILSALHYGNPSMGPNMPLFGTYVSAFTYIQRNAKARQQLNDAYFALLNSGVKHKDINVSMMKDRMDLTCFTFLRNNKKWIDKNYLAAVIKVYLHFAENFVNTNEVEPSEPEGSSPLHIT